MGRAGRSAIDARERRAVFALLEALGSSLDLRLVLERAYPWLLRVVQADHAALGLSRTGRPEDFAWIVTEIPPAFFAQYAEMAPHDFVRAAVAGRPNRVLRDQDMLSRRQLEANMMYHRAREVGAPLEQVMAVMLHGEGGGQSGLSVYREKRRPFSEHERAVLQELTPAIRQAVRNCERFGACARWTASLQALIEDRDAAILLMASPCLEVARSARTSALLERWFSPHERGPGPLPTPLALAIERASSGLQGEPPPWTRADTESVLEVALVALPPGEAEPARWLLLLEERLTRAALPAAWRPLLTAREREVCEAVARGWSNRLIAGELRCAEATVKRHLQNIFDKLGLPSRTALAARALERRPR